jgi:hypothetical protein
MSEDVNASNMESDSQDQPNLVSELSRLGENLGKLVKAAWESDERKTVEKELKSGLDKLNQHINRAVEQTKAEESLTKARETVQDAWTTAHGPQVLREMQAGLVDSLKRFNDEIAKRAEPKAAHEVMVESIEIPPVENQPEHKPTE